MKLNERILEDDYPVYFNHNYVADGEVIVSEINGTVANLKSSGNYKEIKTCDIAGRHELLINEPVLGGEVLMINVNIGKLRENMFLTGLTVATIKAFFEDKVELKKYLDDYDELLEKVIFTDNSTIIEKRNFLRLHCALVLTFNEAMEKKSPNPSTN